MARVFTQNTQAELVAKAKRLMPGGMLGGALLPEALEFVIGRSRGSKLYDLEGREYLDYVLGSGPMILGHAHPAIMEAVRRQIDEGSQFYGLNQSAILLAEKFSQAMPCAEEVKFCSTGTEATFFAMRLARAYTGKPKVLKFEGGYHGNNDYALMSSSPAVPAAFPHPVPDSHGIPREVEQEVLIAPFNDVAMTEEIARKHRDELACIIVEPIQRTLVPRNNFLGELRRICDENQMLLIFDEVVTGFRLAWGGAQEYYGVTPDLAAVAKIAGGGFPLGAIVGKREVVENCNWRNRPGNPHFAAVGGTFSGNPISTVAGLACVTELQKPGTYERLHQVGRMMRDGLREICRRLGVTAQVVGDGPLFNIYFTDQEIVDYRSTLTGDREKQVQLSREALKRGVLTNFATKGYISLAHSDEDIARTLDIFEDSLRVVKG